MTSWKIYTVWTANVVLGKLCPFWDIYTFLGNLYLFIAQNDKSYRYPKKGLDFPQLLKWNFQFWFTMCILYTLLIA